jgi:hypothetical protein
VNGFQLWRQVKPPIASCFEIGEVDPIVCSLAASLRNSLVELYMAFVTLDDFLMIPLSYRYYKRSQDALHFFPSLFVCLSPRIAAV